MVALHELERLTVGGAGRLAALEMLGEHLRRRAIVVLVSDLYEEPQSVADAVGYLRGRGNDVVVFHLLDPAELELPFDGAATFEDLESGERVPVITDQLRERYRTAIRGHVATVGKMLGERGVDYRMVDTSTPLDATLFDFLSRRQRMARVR
jgi:hypothetical protein